MDWVRLEPFALKGKEALIMVDKISCSQFFKIVLPGGYARVSCFETGDL